MANASTKPITASAIEVFVRVVEDNDHSATKAICRQRKIATAAYSFRQRTTTVFHTQGLLY